MWEVAIPVLLKYKKDLAYLCGILLLVGLFFWYRGHLITEGENRIKKADAQAVAVQKAKDDKVLKDAEDNHARELRALRTDIATNPLPPVSLCLTPNSVPKAGLSNGGNAGGGNVAAVHGGDSSVRPEAGPDIGNLLDLFAIRAEELSADARRLNSATHP